jgi:addiction module HigA family antidote
MKIRTRPPTHPGGIIKRLHLEPLGLSVSAAAKALGVSRKTLSKIVNERGAVTPDMALRLARAFHTTPELWLNLQQFHDLWHAERDSKAWQGARVLSRGTAASPHARG